MGFVFLHKTYKTVGIILNIIFTIINIFFGLILTRILMQAILLDFNAIGILWTRKNI
jgi:hypothetical protein